VTNVPNLAIATVVYPYANAQILQDLQLETLQLDTMSAPEKTNFAYCLLAIDALQLDFVAVCELFIAQALVEEKALLLQSLHLLHGRHALAPVVIQLLYHFVNIGKTWTFLP
jgi:hypothetical protein